MLIVRVLLAVAMLALCAGALSQEASDHKAIPEKQDSTKQKKQTAKQALAPIDKAKPEAVKDTSKAPDTNSDGKLEIDRKLAEYTGQLAVYTKELSEYTSDLSRFTLLLVVATAVLGAIGGWQGYLALRSVKVAEAALTTLERPYVFIDLSEPVFTDPPPIVTGDDAVRLTTYNFPRSSIKITYHLVNSERTAAILTHLHHEIVQITTGDMPAPVDAKKEPGHVLPDGYVIDKRRPFTRITSGVHGIHGLFLIGFVRYKDVFEKRHITGFCAIFDSGFNRFTLKGGKDYNYTRDES